MLLTGVRASLLFSNLKFEFAIFMKSNEAAAEY